MVKKAAKPNEETEQPEKLGTLHSIERMTPEEIKETARSLVTNRGYITQTEEELTLSFGFLLSALQYDDNWIAEFGAMFETYNKALPRSINGKPMFISGRPIHRDDLVLINAEWKAMHEAING